MFYALVTLYALQADGSLTDDNDGAAAFFLGNPGDQLSPALCNQHNVTEETAKGLVTTNVDEASAAGKAFAQARRAADLALLSDELRAGAEAREQSPDGEDETGGDNPPVSSLEDAIVNLDPTDDAHWTKSGNLPDLNVLKERLGRQVKRSEADAALKALGYEAGLLAKLGIKNPRGFIEKLRAELTALAAANGNA